jgi:hypothetical protein
MSDIGASPADMEMSILEKEYEIENKRMMKKKMAIEIKKAENKIAEYKKNITIYDDQIAQAELDLESLTQVASE